MRFARIAIPAAETVRRFGLILSGILMTNLTMWLLVKEFGSTLHLGSIKALERSEKLHQVKMILQSEKVRITLYFQKEIPYRRPARIDVFAKDREGNDLFLSKEALLRSIPDSIFKTYKLPYYHVW